MDAVLDGGYLWTIRLAHRFSVLCQPTPAQSRIAKLGIFGLGNDAAHGGRPVASLVAMVRVADTGQSTTRPGTGVSTWVHWELDSTTATTSSTATIRVDGHGGRGPPRSAHESSPKRVVIKRK